jgi:hypothetical protein
MKLKIIKWIRWLGAIASGIALGVLALNARHFVGSSSGVDILLYLVFAVVPCFAMVFLSAFGRFWWSFGIGLWLTFLAVTFFFYTGASPESMILLLAAATVCITPFLNRACATTTMNPMTLTRRTIAGTSHNEHVSTKRPASIIPFWKEISFTKLVLFIMLLPAVVILLDIILGITFSKLSKEIFESEWGTIAYIFYFSLGIWVADYIYRLRKLTLIIVLSFIALFLYRFLIAAIINPEFIGRAMINTLEEGIVVYAALSLFSFFFRYFEPRFDYAEVEHVFESKDPTTKKKYDSGTCSKCGGITIIGRERFHPYLGKSSEYFCDNCNRFLRGNPLNNIFLGLTESASSLLFILGVASSTQGKTSSYSSIFLLLLLVGVYDGIKRLSFGISGVKRSFK